MEKKSHTRIFRKLTSWSLILPLSLLLFGCPYSSSYKIDSEPSVLADDNFVGKWSTIISTATDNQPIRMNVSKKNDYEYDLSFTGRINGLRNSSIIKKDTLKGTAFFSEAASRRFLNINLLGQNYIAEFRYRDDKITILPLCEHFTSKIIKNDSELKMALESHYRTRLYPLYDDDFSISELTRVHEDGE